jgi:hypothetical protein
MLVNDLPGEIQSDSGTMFLSGVKGDEDLFQFFLGYRCPIVGDPDIHMFRINPE